MIQTSYFSSRAPRERKVAIAKYPPRFWKGPHASRLAPSNPRSDDWEADYLADLEERFPSGQGLSEYLAELEAETPDPILCCYERDRAECHRSILAEYCQRHLGLEMPEWASRPTLF